MPMTMNGSFGSLAQDFERMAETAEPGRAEALLEEGAQPILEQMRQNASGNPQVRSGALRGALNVGRAKAGSVTVGVHRKDWSGDEYYPIFVEFGHGGPRPAPPHPFIRPAIDARAEEALNLIREKLSQMLR